jgi:hypothetical protein
MNLPRFTAEAAVYTPANKYLAMAGRVPNSEVVQPQVGGAHGPPSGHWTPCSWLLFSCLEFGDRSDCQAWRLGCVGQ